MRPLAAGVLLSAGQILPYLSSSEHCGTGLGRAHRIDLSCPTGTLHCTQNWAWVDDNTFFSPYKLQDCLQGLGSLANLDALRGTLFQMESRGRALISLCLSNLSKKKKNMLTSHFVRCWLSSFCSTGERNQLRMSSMGEKLCSTQMP